MFLVLVTILPFFASNPYTYLLMFDAELFVLVFKAMQFQKNMLSSGDAQSGKLSSANIVT